MKVLVHKIRPFYHSEEYIGTIIGVVDSQSIMIAKESGRIVVEDIEYCTVLEDES